MATNCQSCPRCGMNLDCGPCSCQALWAYPSSNPNFPGWRYAVYQGMNQSDELHRLRKENIALKRQIANQGSNVEITN